MKPKGKRKIGPPRSSRGEDRVRMTRPILERIRAIHRLLHAKEYPSLKKLAAICEVEPRTIRRDFQLMRHRMGVEVVWNPERNGYAYNGDVSPLPEILLTEEELRSLMLAAQALAGAQFGGWGVQVSRVLDKVSDGLPHNIAMSLAEWDDAIAFHSIGEQKFDAQIFNKVLAAITDRKQLLLTYATPNTEPGDRIVEPYGMAYVNREWNLFAHDYKRGRVICFVPPRMLAVSETGKTFVRPADFRIKDHLDQTFGIYRGDVLYDVVIRFKPHAAHETRERHWPADHKLVQLPDGSVDLHMKLWHLQDIHTFILQMDGKVIPVQPPELVERFICSGERMVEEGRKMVRENGA